MRFTILFRKKLAKFKFICSSFVSNINLSHLGSKNINGNEVKTHCFFKINKLINHFFDDKKVSSDT